MVDKGVGNDMGANTRRRTRRPIRRKVLTVLAIVALSMTSAAWAGAATAAPAAATAQTASPQCTNISVPVALSAGGPADQNVVGQICQPTGQNAIPGAIQVLVSGATYGNSYWDLPYEPDKYSYVQAANQAGFATLDFDRVGIGQSSHPLSTSLTISSDAYAIHELIQDLRAGTLDGNKYTKVVIVGHSLGSLMAWTEAGTYHDVDAVVVSGILHSFNIPGMVHFLTTLYPAALDPEFLGKIVDPGYLTTVPGTRESDFYYPQDTDPAVVQLDEQTKQTATLTEAVEAFVDEVPGELRPVTSLVCTITPGVCDGPASWAAYGITSQINVPVLDVVGQYDSLFCGGPTGANPCLNVSQLQNTESAFYTGTAQKCLKVATLPMAGHDLNLELNAEDWFSMANTWSSELLEQGTAGIGC
jgi:pimeloyl-ACP methyl ester carboxylesterase